MADYYVSTTGSNTSPYDTWAKAALLPHTVINYINASGATGSNIYIANGSYTSALLLTSAKHENTTIIGASRTGVIITALAGNFALYVTNGINSIITDLTLKPDAGANCVRFDAAAQLLNADIVDVSGVNRTMCLFNAAAGTPTVKNLRIFTEYSASSVPVYVIAGNADIINTISSGALYGDGSRPWQCSSTGTVNISNCGIFDSRSDGILIDAAGTVNITNSVISCGIAGTGAYCIKRTAGTVTATNNHLIASLFSGNSWLNGTITDTGNIKTNADPKFRTYPKRGYIMPCVDDSGNFGTYLDGFETQLTSYGFTGDFFLEQAGWDAGDNAALVAMHGRGFVKISMHSYSHSSLETADGAAIWTLGGGTVTVERAVAGGTITWSGGGTVTGFKAKTLKDIRDELAELVGITVTNSAAYTASTIDSRSLGEIIKEAGAGAAQISVLRDATAATGLEKVEMADPKTWLEGILGATVNSFGCPYNDLDANSRAAAIAIGYTNLRGNHADDLGSINLAKALVTSLDMYGIYCAGATTILKGDGTETVIRNNAKALAFAVAQSGMCISVLAHNDTEFTAAQWGYCFDEWQKFGSAIHVCSQEEFATVVRAVGSGWTDDADGTFSRTYAVGDGDYHLEPGSPLLRAGTTVTHTTDFEGNIVPFAGATNIGPYNNQYVGGGGLSPGLGLSGGNRFPWWNRRR